MQTRAIGWSGSILMVALLSSCGILDPQAVPTSFPSGSSATVDQPTPAATAAPRTVRTELRGGRARHTFKSGGVTVKVEYSTPRPVEKWVLGADQPLTVSFTVSSKAATKIYLSRVTAFLYLTDEAGPIDSPDPIVDTASILPGFLVTSPTSYTQIFVLPATPDEATSLNISFRYEMLLFQANSTPRDFEKRTATDTLLVFRR